MPTPPGPRRPAAIPPLDQARVVGAYAQAAIDTAAAAGVDAAALAGAIGVAERDLPPLAEQLPVATYLALLGAGARLAGDPCFGLHVGERQRLSTFAIYGHVLLSCATFGEALTQTRRFEGLAHDLGRTELAIDGDVATYRWSTPWLASPAGPHLPDSVMAGIQTFVTWLAGERLPLLEVAFPHAAPSPEARGQYERIFGARLRFGATVTEARFPAEILERRIPYADTSLFSVVEEHAARALAARERQAGESAIATAARRLLAQRLAQDRAQLGDLATGLGLPVRTLQRKLAEAGTSYQQLLDATRRELAEQYLRDERLSLTEIAFLLGYHEQSSFTHAFRGWHGSSPQQWREARRRRASPRDGT